MRDFLVGPSAAPCNGNIADERIEWRYPLEKIRHVTVRDVLVSPSAAFCNGNIDDGRLKWRCPFGKLRISRDLQKNRIRVVQIEVVGYQDGSINYGNRHHYCREFRSINDLILRNWGACVDTVFGHVSWPVG